MKKICFFLLLLFSFLLNSMSVMAYSLKYRYDYYRYGSATIIDVSETIEGDFVIPSTVTHDGKEYVVDRIGANAFYHQDKMTSVTIPSAITTIDNNAFSNCFGLISVSIAEGNPVYDSRDNCNAFIETATNTLVQGFDASTIPSGVVAIADYAFYRCTGILELTIPEGVTTLGKDAFNDCRNMTSIVIPTSVTTIKAEAFRACM